jgi:hypothetical protein
MSQRKQPPFTPPRRVWEGTVQQWEEHVRECDGKDCDWIAPDRVQGEENP